MEIKDDKYLIIGDSDFYKSELNKRFGIPDSACQCDAEKAKGFIKNTFTSAPKINYIDTDSVNHPNHYNTDNYECIDVMEEVFGRDTVKDFCLCNAFKYIYRCMRKNNEEEDLKKAEWYLHKLNGMNKEDNE